MEIDLVLCVIGSDLKRIARRIPTKCTLHFHRCAQKIADYSLSADPMGLVVRGDVVVVDGAHSDDVHLGALGRVLRAVYGVDGVHLRSAMDSQSTFR